MVWLLPVLVAVLSALVCRAAVRGLTAALSETHAEQPRGRPVKGGVIVITNCNVYLHATAVALAEEVWLQTSYSV